MSQLVLSTQIDEQDWDPLFVIHVKAFPTSPFRNLTPGDLSPSHRAANVESFKKFSTTGPVERANAKISTDGKVIAFLTCAVYPGALGNIEGSLAKPPPPTKLPMVEDEEERVYHEWLFARINDGLRGSEHMHVPHLYAEVLMTDPDWQGRGAGSMLVNWACDYAARKGLQRCTLMADELKVGFYGKLGFSTASREDIVDEEHFPKRKGFTQVIMTKELRG